MRESSEAPSRVANVLMLAGVGVRSGSRTIGRVLAEHEGLPSSSVALAGTAQLMGAIPEGTILGTDSGDGVMLGHTEGNASQISVQPVVRGRPSGAASLATLGDGSALVVPIELEGIPYVLTLHGIVVDLAVRGKHDGSIADDPEAIVTAVELDQLSLSSTIPTLSAHTQVLSAQPVAQTRKSAWGQIKAYYR